MKKSIVAISCMAFMLLFSSAVLAAEFNNHGDGDGEDGVGGTVTITVAGVPGTTTSFTFDSSPKVGISIFTSDTAYAITTANSLTGANNSNGQEYGTLSTASGYAQRDKSTDTGAGPVVTGAADTLPTTGGDWNWQGGS